MPIAIHASPRSETAHATYKAAAVRTPLLGGGDSTSINGDKISEIVEHVKGNASKPYTNESPEFNDLKGKLESIVTESQSDMTKKKPLLHATMYTLTAITALLAGTAMGVWHEGATKNKQIKQLKQQLQQAQN